MEMEPHNDSMCFSSKMYKPEDTHLALLVLFPGITTPTHLIVKLKLTPDKQSQGITIILRTSMKCSKYKNLLCIGFTRAVLSIIVRVVLTCCHTFVIVIKFTCQNTRKKNAIEGFKTVSWTVLGKLL